GEHRLTGFFHGAPGQVDSALAPNVARTALRMTGGEDIATDLCLQPVNVLYKCSSQCLTSSLLANRRLLFLRFGLVQPLLGRLGYCRQITLCRTGDKCSVHWWQALL